MIHILNLLGVNDRNRIDVVLNKGDLSKCDMHFTGNLPLMEFLNPQDMQIQKIALGGRKESKVKIGKTDIIFNSICDPDSNKQTLQNVLKIAGSLNVPVINDPEKVLETNRDKIYNKLKDSISFFMPKTIKVQPKYLKDIIRCIDDKTIKLPFIFREAGAHGGKSSLLVHTMDEIHELEQFAFDGRAYYMTEFMDFVSEDGLYRKYRIAIIDGKPYARHMIAASNWAIHVESRDELMPSSKILREEEKQFLEEGRESFSKMYAEIYEKIGLDFFGMDFAVGKDGLPIIFEVNACMNTVSVSHSAKPFEYHNKRHEEIKNAVLDMIRNRVANKS